MFAWPSPADSRHIPGPRKPDVRTTLSILAALLPALLARPAAAQLRADEVLVIYDTRISTTTEVATYYATIRPGVHLLDLAATGAPVSAPGDISYTDFPTKIRNPIRTFLINSSLTQ